MVMRRRELNDFHQPVSSARQLRTSLGRFADSYSCYAASPSVSVMAATERAWLSAGRLALLARKAIQELIRRDTGEGSTQRCSFVSTK